MVGTRPATSLYELITLALILSSLLVALWMIVDIRRDTKTQLNTIQDHLPPPIQSGEPLPKPVVVAPRKDGFVIPPPPW